MDLAAPVNWGDLVFLFGNGLILSLIFCIYVPGLTMCFHSFIFFLTVRHCLRVKTELQILVTCCMPLRLRYSFLPFSFDLHMCLEIFQHSYYTYIIDK